MNEEVKEFSHHVLNLFDNLKEFSLENKLNESIISMMS